MKTFALLGLAALASATGVANTTTVVSTAFTTVCPGPTTLYYKDKTITVTGSTTLTITDCPCTFTTPASWKNGTTVVPTTAKPATASTTKGTTEVPVGTTGTTKAPVGTTGTKTTPVVVTGTGSTASTVATAGAVRVGSGAALGLVAGVAALVL